MNDENLKPVSKRTKSEAREIGKKGGIASGKSRRRKKALRTLLKEAVYLQIKDIEDAGVRKLLQKATGSKDEEKTVGELVIDGLILSSVRGNSQMMKLLFELMGEEQNLELKRKELKLKEKALMGDGSSQGTAEDVTVYLPAKEQEL